MSSPDPSSPKKDAAGIAFLYILALCIAWSGAWLLSLWLAKRYGFPDGPFGRFAYWLAARILLWFLPSLAILRRSGRSLREVLGFDRIRAILLWGGIAGLLWGGKTPLFQWLAGPPPHPIVWDWSFVTAVVYAPLIEEITFRGAVLGALETRMHFTMANLVTGILFLLIHLPGWYFEGFLTAGFTAAAGAALGILLLGWILGFVAHRSKSVVAATLAHMLNNFFQRFVS